VDGGQAGLWLSRAPKNFLTNRFLYYILNAVSLYEIKYLK